MILWVELLASIQLVHGCSSILKMDVQLLVKWETSVYVKLISTSKVTWMDFEYMVRIVFCSSALFPHYSFSTILSDIDGQFCCHLQICFLFQSLSSSQRKCASFHHISLLLSLERSTVTAQRPSQSRTFSRSLCFRKLYWVVGICCAKFVSLKKLI